jgi:alkylhydroperoxidase/carboxymuconolactone decarboxylase family protein YurZ
MDEDIRQYIIEEFGRIHPVFESMEKYNPELLKGFITSRRSTLPPKGKPEILSRKVKELVMVAVEVALGRGEKGKSHARKAVRAGATPAEIHEVVSL